MNTFYLIRHGQDYDNVDSILNGRRDHPLTEMGINQAIELANQIKDMKLQVNHVLTSPLNRTFVTASIVASINGFSTPIIEPLLIERDFGIMTGKKHSDILPMCSPNILETKTINYFLSPDGAETFPDLLVRAKQLLDKLDENYTNQTLLLATHGDFGKMIFAQYFQQDWRDVLNSFHFGNSEMLHLSSDIKPEDSKKIIIEQYNQ